MADMGVWYELLNQTKKEVVRFHRISGCKALEIAGHPASASMTAWYLLRNSGDAIAFLSDEYGEWPFPTGKRGDEAEYRDITDRLVEELVGKGVLRDEGIAWADEQEPETSYVRAIKNVWKDGRDR
jgi:hypothetical protein